MHSLGFHLGLYILHTLMTIISTDKWPRHEEQNSETVDTTFMNLYEEVKTNIN